MMNRRTVGGSESDAYRYTKKALRSLCMDSERIERYRALAEQLGESSWERHCFNELRRRFFHNGVSAIRFCPGVARIAYGELGMDYDWEDAQALLNLDIAIRMISANHANSYTRNLVHDGVPVGFEYIKSAYGTQIHDDLVALKDALRSREYGHKRHSIVYLDSFETANEYHRYTVLKGHGGSSWCHLGSPTTLESYRRNGSTKLYIALLDGYEEMTPDDPDFAISMLGIDIGPNGELVHVNNRWNHAMDLVDERKGDNKYSAEELSDILGGPYFEICPPYTEHELEMNGVTGLTFPQIHASARRSVHVDSSGRKWKTIRLAGIDWLCDDICEPTDWESAMRHVPSGCRLPTSGEWNAMLRYIGARDKNTLYIEDYLVDLQDTLNDLRDNPPQVHVTYGDGHGVANLGDINEAATMHGINVVDTTRRYRAAARNTHAISGNTNMLRMNLCGFDSSRCGYDRYSWHENDTMLNFWTADEEMCHVHEQPRFTDEMDAQDQFVEMARAEHGGFDISNGVAISISQTTYRSAGMKKQYRLRVKCVVR